jgi:hypothetical protein
MKMKNLMILVLLGIGYLCQGQTTLTVSAFPGRTFTQTRASTPTLHALYESLGAPILYLSKDNTASKWILLTLQHSAGVPSLWATSSINYNMEPPCSEIWVQGTSTYIPITITGTTCINLPIDPIGSSFSSTVYGPVYPSHTTNQIMTIPSPAVGLTVFDLSLGKLRTWNGTAWLPL